MIFEDKVWGGVITEPLGLMVMDLRKLVKAWEISSFLTKRREAKSWQRLQVDDHPLLQFQEETFLGGGGLHLRCCIWLMTEELLTLSPGEPSELLLRSLMDPHWSWEEEHLTLGVTSKKRVYLKTLSKLRLITDPIFDKFITKILKRPWPPSHLLW